MNKYLKEIDKKRHEETREEFERIKQSIDDLSRIDTLGENS